MLTNVLPLILLHILLIINYCYHIVSFDSTLFVKFLSINSFSWLPSGKIVMRKAAGGPPSSDGKSSSPGLRYFSPLRRRRMTVSLPEATDRVGNKSS